MSLEEVQQALLTKFVEDYGTTWANAIAYENVSFNPPAAAPWLAVHFIPTRDSIETLGPNGLDLAKGLFQITIRLPIGTGEGSLRQIVNQLRVSFKPQVLTFSGQPVTILSRGRSTGGQRDNFYVVPFAAVWRALIPRNE